MRVENTAPGYLLRPPGWATTAVRTLRQHRPRVCVLPTGHHQAQWTTLIGPDPPDTVLLLVEHYFEDPNVYVITTNQKAQNANQCICVVIA